MGEIIQLQGDQRDNARAWILENEIVARADAELVRGYWVLNSGGASLVALTLRLPAPATPPRTQVVVHGF